MKRDQGSVHVATSVDDEVSGGILAKVHTPHDLRALNGSQLRDLASEIRELIVKIVGKNGGHLASNLGVVELSIALHRVFDSPKDRIVWDVGHQCYAHKILTGRGERFSGIRMEGGISGFPKTDESPHDSFDTGHSATSISAALGIRVAMDLNGESGDVVAVIGDGALTGGMAMEALSHAGQLGKKLIVILNDNEMSIGPNVGGLSRYLSRISASFRYQQIRHLIDKTLLAVPKYGKGLYDFAQRFKKGIKALFFRENLFSDLGFEYVGPIDGHDIKSLILVMKRVRELDAPVVLHVITQKGRGYEFAEGNPALYHGVSPFSITDGVVERNGFRGFTDCFADSILSYARADDSITAITAAMSKGTGLSGFQAEFPKRFFDVGIAEQHAVTFASGQARAGLKPVVAIYSTFMQRALDQALHDACLQSLPVTFCLDRSGLVPDDGPTHQGIYDIPQFRSMPNLAILAPADASELHSMLGWALASGGPCLLRYPKAPCPSQIPGLEAPLARGRGAFVDRGFYSKSKEQAACVILTTGGLIPQGIDACVELEREGQACDLYNVRFIKPIDEDYLASLLSGYELALVAEDTVAAGGLGELVATLASSRGISTKLVLQAVPDRPLAQATRPRLLEISGLSGHRIAQALLATLGHYAHTATTRSGLSR